MKDPVVKKLCKWLENQTLLKTSYLVKFLIDGDITGGLKHVVDAKRVTSIKNSHKKIRRQRILP